jgi:hypothetical protein
MDGANTPLLQISPEVGDTLGVKPHAVPGVTVPFHPTDKTIQISSQKSFPVFRLYRGSRENLAGHIRLLSVGLKKSAAEKRLEHRSRLSKIFGYY